MGTFVGGAIIIISVIVFTLKGDPDAPVKLKESSE